MRTVLYVDDEAPNLALFRRWFADSFDVRTVASPAEAIAALEADEFAVVVSDQRMPERTGIDLLAEVGERWPDIGRILMTAYSDRDLLLSAIQRGHVHDYVLKPWQAEDVGIRLERAVDAYRRQRALHAAGEERDRLRTELADLGARGAMIGLDGDLRTLATILERVAATDSTVLIRGETGTGKELIARELHERSRRAQEPFVRIHCAAISEGVLESDLFGHEAGAFPGARGVRIGRFEQAHRGTLFLDEIGELPLAIQVKLLRVLQEREIERVGGNKTIKIDIRVVAATHRNLEQLVRDGKLREDLFFRINVVSVQVPPLRDRPSDLQRLLRHFVASCGSAMGKQLAISDAAMAALARYDWPGNVRELKNVIERAAAIADPVAELDVDDFEFAPRLEPPAIERSLFAEIADAEAERIRDALRQAGGSKARAARLLGIPRTTLNDRIERLGIR